MLRETANFITALTARPFCLGGDSFVVSLNNLFRVCLFSPKTGMRYSRGPMSVAEEVEGRENDEKRLLRHLMRGYERDVRPVKNASTPVVIQLSITLTQIFDMVQPPINDWLIRETSVGQRRRMCEAEMTCEVDSRAVVRFLFTTRPFLLIPLCIFHCCFFSPSTSSEE